MTVTRHEQIDKEEQLLSNRGYPYYVGIGASAGGLEALQVFFDNMPSQNNLCFVVIQHLSPDYKSLMLELLSKYTEMTIYRSEEGMLIRSNCIYLIPPKKNLKIVHGKIRLEDQERRSSEMNLPVDIFFRSLAKDQGEKAIGVILSGTGSDGARGVRAIKEAGGMVMVQTEESAKFNGMPRNAISTGTADYTLSPEEMPAQILSFVGNPNMAKEMTAHSPLDNETGLTRIFSLVREKHKVDFTEYKPSTVLRRIERRMVVNRISRVNEYVKYLEGHTVEVSMLYRDMLIGVTNFFRDSEAFDLLREKYIPQILKQSEDNTIRIWVAGCSTGEEAYSLAILFSECIQEMKDFYDIKIFASDVDEDAIIKAGIGSFSASIVADLKPEFLSKYFIKNDDNYRIKRGIREMVVFTQHNLLKDPPFTSVDLVTCRNLLIYFQPVLQQKVMEHFNFSLKERGILFLGHSENIGEMADYFDLLDANWKLYQSKGKQRSRRMDVARSIPMQVSKNQAFVRKIPDQKKPSHKEDRILERLILLLGEDYQPFAAVTDENMNIVYILSDQEGFLQYNPGVFSPNVANLSNQELALPFSTGLQKAFKTREEIVYSNMHLTGRDSKNLIRMRIKLLPEQIGQPDLAAIFIEEIIAGDNLPVAKEISHEEIFYDVGEDAQQRIKDMEHEIHLFKLNLKTTVEELESSNEEMMSSNEELQSTNEELQSVNEELHTVNAEHQQKIIELTWLNTDMDNMLHNIQIGILFLDEDLAIRRYTTTLDQIYRIIDGDIGRSLGHLSHNLIDCNPLKIAEAVIQSHQPEEHEVKSESGEWYLMRVLPYLLDHKDYSGVIITFTDITMIRSTHEKLIKKNEELDIAMTAIESAHRYIEEMADLIDQPLILLDQQLNALAANQRFCDNFALEKSSIGRTPFYELNHGRWGTLVMRNTLDNLKPNDKKTIEIEYDFGQSGKRTLQVNVKHLTGGVEGNSLILVTIPIQN